MSDLMTDHRTAACACHRCQSGLNVPLIVRRGDDGAADAVRRAAERRELDRREEAILAAREHILRGAYHINRANLELGRVFDAAG